MHYKNLPAQVIIQNETLASQGSPLFTIADGSKIKQSIGQISVIGNFSNEILQIKQGFLQGYSGGIISFSESIIIHPYPNPFKDVITFRFIPAITKDVSLTIYDMFGQLVVSEQLNVMNNEVIVDLAHLSNALYLAIFRSENQLFKIRIVKNMNIRNDASSQIKD